ncbi:fluoride efflux transporter CrcB [Parvibium lacunae]|uniref:Fluoride-specific ion channel FluC n=1 Tax=Parvibium lacunae TaxID=1888893 RepID=A0A368L734_9BURK|nr:fluoride efflux transporter CrcB [Parvibium lacunae]RCS59424.1 fluoride efflux transporter CrcB [Parvibium lacunae]
MSPLGFLAVGVGAALGAWLRWWLGLVLNSAGATVPLGTWLANLIGGYLIGLAAAGLSTLPELNPAWRLLIITGFLGGLTTFSTFSAENFQHWQEGRWIAAGVHMLAHVLASLFATYLGWLSAQRFI